MSHFERVAGDSLPWPASLRNEDEVAWVRAEGSRDRRYSARFWSAIVGGDGWMIVVSVSD